MQVAMNWANTSDGSTGVREQSPRGRQGCRGFVSSGIVLFLVLGGVASARSDSAAIAGLVIDTSGGRIREARVTALHTDTKSKSETQTNESGVYGLAALRPGRYTLTIEAPGFRTKVTSAIELQVQQRAMIDFTLEVGQITRANQPLSVAGAQHETYVGTERRLLTALKEAEKLGPRDLRLPTILSNLGAFYKVTSKPAEAEKFYLRSLAVREKIGGANHSSLAEPLGSLVALYLENGIYSRAERLHRRMMAVLPALVPGDPDSASLLHNFAAVYYVQRKYSEAEPLYLQALASVVRHK